ncbi:MAG: ABC transporter ATP-binding protein [Chitinivibrionia bacterium]|nr:ABC transporter ATP-binding protein [Chitinivibrionia bacterium]
MSIFEAKHLSLHYLTRFGSKVHAAVDISFELEEGEILGIAGESGCGKTTLVSGLSGMCIPPLNYTSGEIFVSGQPLIGRPLEDIRENVLAKEISMIPQGAYNALNPTRKIKDLAMDVLKSHEKGKANKKEMYQRIHNRFELLGLDTDKVLNSYSVQLTPGEKQRSVIGISTLLNPKMVIADEPTSALDVTTQKQVIGVIFDLLEKKVFSTMIFITHELPLLRHVADRIAVMYAGEIVEMGTSEQLVFSPKHPYTQALMSAMLSAEEGARKRKPEAIEGAPPNLAEEIVGCRFAPRCKHATDGCKKNKQEIRIVDNRQVRCENAK